MAHFPHSGDGSTGTRGGGVRMGARTPSLPALAPTVRPRELLGLLLGSLAEAHHEPIREANVEQNPDLSVGIGPSPLILRIGGWHISLILGNWGNGPSSSFWIIGEWRIPLIVESPIGELGHGPFP